MSTSLECEREVVMTGAPGLVGWNCILVDPVDVESGGLTISHDEMGRYKDLAGGGVRYAVERVVAAVVLLALAPLLMVVALMIRMFLGSPVLFRQERAGKGGTPFCLVKFHTMTDARRADGRLLPDEDRITGLGSILRATSLDELPSLWNVVRGEMALVGPRPLPTAYVERYTPFEARRLEVRPGITGWAQVNGRNSLSWEERLAMDVWYVDHRSWRLDLKILWQTVSAVLKRDGISAPDHVTMHEFRPPKELGRSDPLDGGQSGC